MPKATATKKATSSSSKTAPKKGVLGKSFSLRSRKVQFFVTILVIAIVGGGYLTYKSFASVVGSWGLGELKCLTNTSTCYVAKEPSSSGKSTPSALEIIKGGSIGTTRNTDFVYNQPYSVCITAKGTGFITIYGPQPNPVLPPATSSVAVTNATNYQRYCAPAFKVSNPGGPGQAISSGLSLTNVGGNAVRVSLVELDQTNFNPNPTPVK